MGTTKKTSLKAKAIKKGSAWYIAVESTHETLYFLCCNEEDATARASILNGMVKELIDSLF